MNLLMIRLALNFHTFSDLKVAVGSSFIKQCFCFVLKPYGFILAFDRDVERSRETCDRQPASCTEAHSLPYENFCLRFIHHLISTYCLKRRAIYVLWNNRRYIA